jgi:hypothetical protein
MMASAIVVLPDPLGEKRRYEVKCKKKGYMYC